MNSDNLIRMLSAFLRADVRTPQEQEEDYGLYVAAVQRIQEMIGITDADTITVTFDDDEGADTDATQD